MSNMIKLKIVLFMCFFLLGSAIIAAQNITAADNNTGFVDLDTVSVIGFYENYPLNFYIYKKLSEKTDATGKKVLECGPTPFNFNINFQVIKNRNISGIGIFDNMTTNLSEILIYPGTMHFTNLDNMTTPPLKDQNLPTFGGLVKPGDTNTYKVQLDDFPAPDYNELMLLTWGDDDYKYLANTYFDVLEFKTGVMKKLHLFEVPYNISGCDRACKPLYCTSSGLYFRSNMNAEFSDIIPDRIETYRDETGAQDAVATIRIKFMKTENTFYDTLENALEEWVVNPQNSRLQILRGLIAKPFQDLSQIYCDDNSTNSCLFVGGNPMCSKVDEPNLVDYLFCGSSSRFLLPSKQFPLILSSLIAGFGDYFSNPTSSAPLSLLQLFAIGWPVYGFRIEFVKVEYDPIHDEPGLKPLVYNITEDYGRNYSYVRSPDLFEWFGNDPVEKVIDIKVADGKKIEDALEAYHNRSLDYNIKITLYLVGDYPTKAKIVRNGKLYIDLDD
jgi:hypothetical protein